MRHCIVASLDCSVYPNYESYNSFGICNNYHKLLPPEVLQFIAARLSNLTSEVLQFIAARLSDLPICPDFTLLPPLPLLTHGWMLSMII